MDPNGVQTMIALAQKANLSDQQQQQLMQMLSQQQGGGQVDVGACGPQMNPALAGAAPGFGPNALGPCNQPNLSDLVAQNCAVYRDCVFPVGVFFAVDSEGNIYPFGTLDPSDAEGQQSLRIFADRGNYTIFGVKTMIGCNRVLLTSVITGDAEFDHIQGDGVDACAYNTDNCYCYANWGCFSTSNSFQLQAQAISGTTGLEQFVGTLWCIREQALNSCGPIPSCGAIVAA